MDIRTIIRTCVRESGFRYEDVARTMGYEGDHPSEYVAVPLSKGRFNGVSLAVRMLDAVGYKLVAVPKSKRVRDAFDVTIDG